MNQTHDHGKPTTPRTEQSNRFMAGREREAGAGGESETGMSWHTIDHIIWGMVIGFLLCWFAAWAVRWL